MGIADARAMHPSIDVVEAEPEADRRLLEALADWCDRYTPLVAIDGADGLYLDITGCAHLFGGEEAMLDELVCRLSDQGFDARAGLGSTPGAAWAAARFRLPPVGSGEEAMALSPLPLSALRIDRETRASLESVGLRTVGSVLAAPRAPLARRFGKTLIIRLDQALGRVEEAITPRLPVAALSAERHFAEPISHTEDIERLILMLAATLKGDLERRGEGARRLQLALFRVDGAVSRIGVGTSRPMREPALIGRLFHERLTALEGDIDAGYGFDLVRLAVLSSARIEDAQTDLAGDTIDASEDLALFADRIRARLGDNAVLVPVMVESHIPERATVAGAFRREAPGCRRPGYGLPRMARIRPNGRSGFSAIRSRSRSPPRFPKGRRLAFHWRRALHRVAAAEGPERIAPEWWRDKADAPTRDYFRVEDEAGRRYWLFREGFYGGAKTLPRWFMHGIFA